MSSVSWGTFFAAVGELGTVVAAIGLIIGMRSFRKQMSAQTFLAYTERYERIMGSMPEGARVARFDADADLWAADPHVQTALLRYFNMCSEAFYLHTSGYLDTKLWAIWEDEIKRTVRSKLGRRVWSQVDHEFDSYPAFQTWVRDAQDAQASPTGITKVELT